MIDGRRRSPPDGSVRIGLGGGAGDVRLLTGHKGCRTSVLRYLPSASCDALLEWNNRLLARWLPEALYVPGGLVSES